MTAPDSLTVATAVAMAQDAQRFARIALWHWFREMSENQFAAGWDRRTITCARKHYAMGDLPQWAIDALNLAGWPDDDLTWQGERAEVDWR